MVDDVILGKAEIIERCLRRLDEVYAGESRHLRHDLLRQDSILLNLERACQAAIDLALRVVKLRQLGVPRESRECFSLLAKAGLVPADLAAALQRMVGFRNLAVHDYQRINLDIVESILRDEPARLRQFVKLCLQLPE
jgi:uncharacterized protein YutE (UPF0331/DUF86 family)